MISREVDTRDT